MVDAWRGDWLTHNKSAVKDFVDVNPGKLLRDKARNLDKIHKELISDIGVKSLRDVAKNVPDVPPKGPKEVVEVPGSFDDEGDPFAAILDRVSRLEAVVHRQAFIRPQERPQVG
jgi:hypothetical protein